MKFMATPLGAISFNEFESKGYACTVSVGVGAWLQAVHLSPYMYVNEFTNLEAINDTDVGP